MNIYPELFDADHTAKRLQDVFWKLLTNAPINFVGSSIDEVVNVSKAYVTLLGSEARGAIFPAWAQGHRNSAIIHGEYGHVIITITDPCDGDKLGYTLSLSDSYTFKHLPQHTVENMKVLLVQAVASGMKAPMLIQWYDSTYRKVTGRRISPHFDEITHVDKLVNNILPGLLVTARE